MPAEDSDLYGIGDVSELPGGFPATEQCLAFSHEEAQQLAKELEPKTKALLAGDADAFEELYYEDGFFRDLVALTWTFRTFHSKATIRERLPPLLSRAGISDVALIPQQVQVIDLPQDSSLLRLGYSFRTSNPPASCHAALKFIRLRDGGIKLFTTSTSLQELDAAPWGKPERGREVPKDLPKRCDIVVVGAGHAGLSISSYLQALNLDFVILDREEQVGDAWAKRYDSATLHTTKIFSGLPYKPFPSDYPQFVPAKLIARYYRDYVHDLNLPVYQNTTVNKANWDEADKEWTVQTNNGQIVARAIIFANGIGGRFPNMPVYPGMDTFKGPSMHSIRYTNPGEWKGKKIAVVGASTTGLDVAWDCSRAGLDVTVVQRGPTRIYAPDHIETLQMRIWNEENGVELGDTIATEDPVALGATLSALSMKMSKEAYDLTYYENLEKAGFLAQHDGPVQNQIFCHGGKHYPDIGAGHAIGAGEIKIKSGTKISRVVPSGLDFEDGTHLDADVLCWCTGFAKDTRDVIAGIIGKEIKLEPIWNLDGEGEIRGVYRPTGHDGIWFTGGELQVMRYYGKFMAAQIAAVLAGVRPEPVRT